MADIHEQAPLSLEAQMASEAYWQGPVFEPFAPDTYKSQGTRKPHQLWRDISRDTEKGQEIAHHLRSCQGGGSIDPIITGDPIVFPSDHSRQVIKVVTDCRTKGSQLESGLAYLEPNRKRFMRSLAKRERETPDHFEKDAQYLDSESMPLGITACKFAIRDNGKRVLLTRRVQYIRASASPAFGIAASISYEPDSGDLIPYDVGPFPAVTVGSLFRNRRGALVRVILADIIEPHGLIWKPPLDGQNGRSNKQKGRSLARRPIPLTS